MPSRGDPSRSHARRGGIDRGGDLRRRHPNHRGAAQLARPARQRRKARGPVRRIGADRRRHRSRSRRRRPGERGRRPPHCLAQHLPAGDRGDGGGRHGLAAGLFHTVGSVPGASGWGDGAEALPGRGHDPAVVKAQRAVLPGTCRSSSSAGSAPARCRRGSKPAPTASGWARDSTGRVSRRRKRPPRRGPMWREKGISPLAVPRLSPPPLQLKRPPTGPSAACAFAKAAWSSTSSHQRPPCPRRRRARNRPAPAPLPTATPSRPRRGCRAARRTGPGRR